MGEQKFEYKGFECLKNYMGHYAIYPIGGTQSITNRATEDDCKRWIDKYWKENGK